MYRQFFRSIIPKSYHNRVRRIVEKFRVTKQAKNDIDLLKKWLLRKEIPMLSPRNINEIGYWDGISEVMKEDYVNKPEAVCIREAEKDKITNEFIRKVSPKNLLEVGCGFGYSLKKLCIAFPDIEMWGCDFSSMLIEQAKIYLKDNLSIKNLKVADATKISHAYQSKKFDLLITHGCLMCLKSEQVKNALAEFSVISKYILLIEADYSKMNLIERLRYKQERNYPINDYRKIINSIDGLRLLEVDKTFSKDRLITSVSFFYIEVTK